MGGSSMASLGFFQGGGRKVRGGEGGLGMEAVVRVRGLTTLSCCLGAWRERPRAQQCGCLQKLEEARK